ncbi:MAG TPA: ATP-binding protein [Tepidisphaeraceae bacterium]|jgi:anti-sigma regulatory factor (Ser/Thr protein kinase)|nr:ATP-binding protein [Tepidisphaeraceae bacterium]
MPSANPSNAALDLSITSDPAQLAPARKSIESFCLSHGLDEKATEDMGLCVNEAMANITRHAYAGRTDRPIALRAADTGQAVEVSMRDWGNGVNPAELAVKPKDPLVPGGLGLVCLRSLMDDVRFEPQADGMRLTLTKRKTPATKEPSHD